MKYEHIDGWPVMINDETVEYNQFIMPDGNHIRVFNFSKGVTHQNDLTPQHLIPASGIHLETFIAIKALVDDGKMMVKFNSGPQHAFRAAESELAKVK